MTARSSSQSSSNQMANAVGLSAPAGQAHIFGKTSGWYHGAKYDTGDMWQAAINGENDTLKRCLKAGLNVNHSRWVKADKVVGTGARSVADAVACRNNVKAMSLLIEHGVDFSGTTMAAFVSHTQSQRAFLLTGDDRKLAEKEPWTTPLHLACRYGYLDLVRIILEEGHADPNTRDCQNRTGLHATIIGNGVPAVAKLLIDRGATVDAKDMSEATPLAVAALYGKLELVELLMNHGAVLDAIDSRGETALYNASLRNHSSVVAALVARGANIDLRNIDGMSPFFKAASSLKTEGMDTLTECGADTDTRDKNGCTALIRASMAKNIPLIMHLLKLGVDIDAEDSDGWTPFFVAMLHNDEDLIRIFLAYGSNMEKTDHHHNTALHQAAMLGASLVIRHMLALHTFNNTNNTQMNIFGETPLAIACKHNNSPVVKILLKHGANPHQIDPNGYRAIDRAMYWGSHACVRLLLEAGVAIDDRMLHALQQGKHDKADGAGSHDMILVRLQSQYPALAQPLTTTSSQLRDLFSRTIKRDNLSASMREKQGKPPLDLTLSIDEKSSEEVVSPDPFEACIPKPPPPIIINNSTTNIKANGTGTLEVGAAGANLALGITNTILNSI
ncbi:ankyrin repeat-containing domain protein [Tricladium varicosporioides]|nr:ankyrin repeat-containing domain protein [Hymenoscyphus varicosporioides]